MEENKIIWNGKNNHLIELKILNYEFPEENEDYDANWITLDIKARNELGVWNKQCPCMLSWEIKWFSKWFDNIAKGLTEENEIFVYEFDFGMKYLEKYQNIYKFKTGFFIL